MTRDELAAAVEARPGPDYAAVKRDLIPAKQAYRALYSENMRLHGRLSWALAFLREYQYRNHDYCEGGRHCIGCGHSKDRGCSAVCTVASLLSGPVT